MSHHDPNLARQLAVTLSTLRSSAPRAQELKRPSLLVRAARIASADWRRARDLPKLLGPTPPRDPLPRLLEEEARQNDLRRQGHYGWSMRRHLLLLAAIIAECATASESTSQSNVIMIHPATPV